MRRFIQILIIGLPLLNFSQEEEKQVVIDSLYREDQFYASMTYNALTNLNSGVSQSGFSTGFHLGFIRDMPINKRRNIAIGLGVGLSSNSYNQNILIGENSGSYSYDLINESEINVTKNKFTTYLIDVPIELRWRTSETTVYKFWRIYPGFKFSYLLYNSTKLRSDIVDNNLSNVTDFNELQYGLTLSVGYGDWNFHFYYGLNPIFSNQATLNDQSLDISAMKIGIMFYIL